MQVHKISAEEKRKSDLMDIMPDAETALVTRNLLHHLSILPEEYRMSLLRTQLPTVDCTNTRRHK